jgi:dTDP-4-amino-4,6-dideoxygalactose transaminase
MNGKPIYVTKPHLPPLEDFIPYLEEIWASGCLTNGGPMHQRLERELAAFLGVPFVSLFNNATNALMVALNALNVAGEVITTPYSFVATTHSLLWSGNRPVFVDIDPVTLNMDPARIEAAISEDTTAIMPVHCYGTPCDVEAIRTIAHEHGLKVIYDAAHAFAVDGQSGSVLNYGDLSVLSFHATKVFNTFEGGAIISQDAAMKRRIDSLKNFGIQNEVTVTDAGINGKMAEVNAAFGLLQLKSVREAIATRKAIAELYQVELADVPGIRYVQEGVSAKLNYGYFPILVGTEYPLSRDALYERLKASNVYSRRYFYPLLSDLPMYSHLPSASRSNLPTAAVAAERILCLPIFPTLDHASVTTIAGLIRANAERS